MAAPIVQAVSAGSSGTNVQGTLGAAPTNGNLLVAWVAQQATGNTLTAAGSWNKLNVASSGDDSVMFWKKAGAGESATQTPCTSSSSTRNWSVCIAEYSQCSGVSPLLAQNNQVDNNGTKTSPTVTPTAGVRALVVGAAMSTSAGTTFSTEQVNGSATGVTERKDQGSGSGSNQTHGALWDQEVTSTSGSYSTTAVASAAESGSCAIAIFQLDAAGLTVAVGQTTETDAAQAVTRSKTKSAGQPAEMDTSQPVARRKSKAFGQSSEAAAAQPMARAKLRAAGQVVEADTAQSLARLKAKAVGQPAETDAAQVLGRAKSRTLGQPAETETALPIRALKTRAVGQAGETDAALPVLRLKALTVGQALEANAALMITRLKQLVIGQASESDLGQTITFVPAVVEGELALSDVALTAVALALTAGAAVELSDASIASLVLADTVA